MRKKDKKIHLNKVNLLFEERCLIERLDLKEEIFDYTLTNHREINPNYTDKYNYRFNANGIPYSVSIWHDERKHSFGEFEVEFNTPSQKHSGDRVKNDKGGKHAFSVVQTVVNIVDETVRNFKIRKIKIEGARDEKDSGDALFKGSIRSQWYLRVIERKYPSDAVKAFGPWINIDMTKVYPDIFESTKELDELVKTLIEISDEDPNENNLKQVDGVSLKNFNAGGEVFNSKVGYMEVQILTNYEDGYDLEISFEEDYDEIDKSFNELSTLIDYLKRSFLVNNKGSELNVKDEIMSIFNSPEYSGEVRKLHDNGENDWEIGANLTYTSKGDEVELHIVISNENGDMRVMWSYFGGDKKFETFRNGEELLNFLKNFNN
jgi:hypothetical protein